MNHHLPQAFLQQKRPNFVGKTLVRKHVLIQQELNKNSIKIRHTCLDNKSTIIKKDTTKKHHAASYTKKASRLRNKITTNKDTTKLHQVTLKRRFSQHIISFRNKAYAHRREISNCLWELHRNKPWSDYILLGELHYDSNQRCVERLASRKVPRL